MKKIKNLLKNKRVLIAIGVILVIIIVVIVILVLPKENVEQNLENSLKEMGQDFYENYYYDQTGTTDEEKADFLSRYATIGIKINLDNLGRYNSEVNQEKIAEFVNPDTNESCDKENTRVIIYPKESYGKTDYDIEVELVCGFDEE